jgi:holo-[acyl-carrier protein] synthase
MSGQMLANVLSIGVDLVEVDGFRGLVRTDGTVMHFLTEAEIEDAFCRKEMAQTLAGRFAAKEAVIKAAGTAFPGRHIFFHDIIIDHNASGAPRAIIPNLEAGNYQILLSISHTEEHAIAFAMVVRKDDEHE